MVHFKAFLVYALIASVSARPASMLPLDLGSLLGGLGGAVGGILGMVNQTGQTLTNLVNQGVQGVAGTANQLVGTVTGLGSSALNGVTGVLKGGVDAVTNVAGIVPGLGGIANLGGGLLKSGLDVANSLGQTGLSVGGGLAGSLTQGVGNVASAGTGIVSSGLNAVTGLANIGGMLGNNGGTGSASVQTRVIPSDQRNNNRVIIRTGRA